MDTDDVLRVLVHDIRSPLGVAEGYLRLLADGRLKTADEREQAMEAAMRALAHIGTLCEYATACIDVSAPPSMPAIPAVHLCDRIAELIKDRIGTAAWDAPDGNVKVGTNLDRMAAAVVAALPPGQVEITHSDSTLRFTTPGDGHSPSLAQIAAERAIDAVGGRVDRSTPAGRVHVIFLLETTST
jgi:signal transduction histidine kinase